MDRKEKVLISTALACELAGREAGKGRKIRSGGDCGQLKRYLTTLKGKWDLAPGSGCWE